jgi:putative transposase
MQISRSCYYRWLSSPLKKRDIENIILKTEIKIIHKESFYTYGQRRIKAKLKEKGINCSCKRIGNIMSESGLYSRLRKKYKHTTAPNLLKRNFYVEVPNKVWVGDITYIPTGEGYLYLASVIDLFDNKIVGWSIDTRMKTELTITALDKALKKIKIPDGLVFHSDRGSQYAAYRYQNKLRRNNIVQSMSRKGNCFDNACAESFFATLKKDIIHGRYFNTRDEARLLIFEYMEIFYNSNRISNVLGYKTPNQFRNEYYKEKSA